MDMMDVMTVDVARIVGDGDDLVMVLPDAAAHAMGWGPGMEIMVELRQDGWLVLSRPSVSPHPLPGSAA